MRVTIFHVVVDKESDTSDSGFIRGANEEGFTLSEAFAKVMRDAEWVAGTEGTIEIKGFVSIGIDEDDECKVTVIAQNDVSRESWSFCRI